MSATSIQSVRPTRRIGAWTLQGILAAAFLAAGFAKLAGVPFMVDLFAQIGIGQWFRVVTGVVEVTGAVALLDSRPGFDRRAVARWHHGRCGGDPSVRPAHQPGPGDRPRIAQRGGCLPAAR